MADILNKNLRSDFFNYLPDRIIMLHIFGKIPEQKDRSACACVCKHWLLLQSQMHFHDFIGSKKIDCPHCRPDIALDYDKVGKCKSRSWTKDATDVSLASIADVRLASIAIGRSSKGRLSIQSKDATDVGIIAIGLSCSNLMIISLADCPYIGDDGLKSIAYGCTSLRKLHLINCPAVGDASILSIARTCTNLYELFLDSCCGIGDKSMDAIATFCRKLSSLHVRNCKLIGNEGGISISKCKAIRELTLGPLKLKDESLISLGQTMSSVAVLCLQKLNYITEKGFVSLAESTLMLHIRSLTIENCKGATDHFITSLVKNLKPSGSMRSFTLSKLDFITEEGFMSLAKLSCSINLETIIVRQCRGATEDFLMVLAQHLKSFPKVVIHDLYHLRPAYLRIDNIKEEIILATLGNIGLNLEHLALYGWQNISERCLLAIQQCTSLTSLRLDACNVPETAIKQLKKKFSKCTIE